MWRPTRRRILWGVATAAAGGTLPAATRNAVDSGESRPAADADRSRPAAEARKFRPGEAPNGRTSGVGGHFSLDWQRTYGDGGYDRLEAVAATDDGVVLAGQSDDPPGSRWAGWLHRAAPNGDTRWHRTFDEDWLEAALAVATVEDGFLVAGRRRASPQGNHDAWVRRTDAEGGVLWRWTGDADGDDAATAIVDGRRVAGTTEGEDGTVAWIREFGPDGEVRAHRTYGGERARNVVDAAATDDGGAFLAGTRGVARQPFADAWLARVDAGGELVWSRAYGGDRAERASAVHATADGALFVGLTGSRDGPLWDVWVVAVDADGRRRWERTHGGDGTDYATDLLATGDGYLVVGATDSGDRDRFDALALGVDPEGAYRWHRTDGRGGRDIARAVVPVGTASEPAAGEADTPAGDGDPTVDGVFVAGRYGSSGRARIDAWLVRLARVRPTPTPTPAPEPTPTPSPTPAPDPTPPASPTPTIERIDVAEARETETTVADGPGFGVPGVLGALGTLGLGRWLLGRRDRDGDDGQRGGGCRETTGGGRSEDA